MSDSRGPRRPSAPPRVLSIAGSDSGGGAGIQADLKAFARCGVHGMTAITAVTAQSTVGVLSVHQLPDEVVVEQVRAVAEDIGVDAVKIGMLGTTATILAVERALGLLPGVPVVLDPVMVAETGAVLLDDDARATLRERLVVRAAVLTPNRHEAQLLVAEPDDDDGSGAADRSGGHEADGGGHKAEGGGQEVDGDCHEAEGERLARAVHALGPRVVVVTGGHLAEATDVYFDGEQLASLSGERHPDGAAHGSGCTHSSALAAGLAHGLAPLEAARRARALASEAVRSGLRGIGSGAGPVDVLGIAERA